MDLTELSAWAAAIGVIVAVTALAVQVRQAAFNASLDSLWHLEDRFNSLVRERSIAARYLGANPATESGPKDAQAPAELDEVLDFFSLLGYLVSAGAIRKEAAWMNFSSWAFAYWFASQEHVNERRQENPLYWRHYEQLVATMEDVETKRLLIFDDGIRGLAWMPRGLRWILSFGRAFAPKDWLAGRQRTELSNTIAKEAFLDKSLAT